MFFLFLCVQPLIPKRYEGCIAPKTYRVLLHDKKLFVDIFRLGGCSTVVNLRSFIVKMRIYHPHSAVLPSIIWVAIELVEVNVCSERLVMVKPSGQVSQQSYLLGKRPTGENLN